MTALRRRTLLAVVLAGGTVTACTEQDDSATDGTGGASDGGGEVADPGAVVAEGSFFLRHTEVAVRVPPIVRSGEHLVLTVDLTAEGDAAEFEDQYVVGGTLTGEVTSAWSDGWGSASGGDTRDFLGVRLVDLTGDQVASTAVDAEGKTVGVRADNGETADSGTQALAGTVQIALADPGTDALAVYLPKLPLVTDVPVIEAEVPEVEGTEEQLDLSAIEEAPLEPMLLMSQDLAEPLRETREVGTTTVAISSDVLFDSSSSELDEAAKSALDEAARRIESHEPGSVTVIGHTDSVDSNLTLSKERAAAVATALEKRLDTSDYELSTDGKGEAEPIASNDTEDGKALNRRVEIVLETPLREEEVTREMPEFEGKTGTAAEGVQFDGSEHEVIRPFDLQLGAARIIQDHLVVTLEVTATDEEHSGVYGIGQFDDGIGMPEEPDGVSTYTILASCGAVGVLVGSTLTYAAFHRAGGPADTTRPLTDLAMNDPADGGVPRTPELVFPRDIAGVEAGAEVALQYGVTGSLGFANEETWRMTEVEVGA